MFASNTGISTSHNYRIFLNRGEERTFRVLLRPEVCGDMQWRFFFSNSVDSTWADGSESWANLMGGRFEIVSCTAGAADAALNMSQLTAVAWPQPVAEPAACLTSEPVRLTIPEGGYIAFSWCLRAMEDGCLLPATPDSRSLCWSAEGERVWSAENPFSEDTMAVLPDCFEADRDIRLKMVFMGDSITQGCQTRANAYEQWAARIAMGMERQVSVWNIGLGYGRGEDAARNGAWLKKAARADVVNLCFGVNDLLSGGRDADAVTSFLKETVDALHHADHPVKVVLFTIPPFDLQGEQERNWRAANQIIREDGLGADYVFDFAAILGQDAPNEHRSIFGGHPDGRGGAMAAGEYLSHFWPMELRPGLKDMLRSENVF